MAVAGSDTAQYQVLLRMRQPDGSLLPASQVIPAAELAGGIAQIDHWVLEHALFVLAERQAQGPSLRLFVSQSPRTLSGDAYPAWVLQSLQDRLDLTHEYLHLAFDAHPNGQDETYIEGLARHLLLEAQP